MQGKLKLWAASSIALLVTENYAESTDDLPWQDISYLVISGTLHSKVSY